MKRLIGSVLVAVCLSACGARPHSPAENANKVIVDSIKAELTALTKSMRDRVGVYEATGETAKRMSYFAFDASGTAFALVKEGDGYTATYTHDNDDSQIVSTKATLKDGNYSSPRLNGSRVRSDDVGLAEEVRMFAQLVEAEAKVHDVLQPTNQGERYVQVLNVLGHGTLKISQTQVAILRELANRPKQLQAFVVDRSVSDIVVSLVGSKNSADSLSACFDEKAQIYLPLAIPSDDLEKFLAEVK